MPNLRKALHVVRNLMTKIITIIFLQLVFALVTNACDCASTPTVKESFQTSHIILVGRVLSKEHIGGTQEDKLATVIRYTILISKVYKGSPKQDTISVFTGSSGGVCGVSLFEGREYIIYGLKYNPSKITHRHKKKEKLYWTHICTRTQEVNPDELNQLQEFTK